MCIMTRLTLLVLLRRDVALAGWVEHREHSADVLLVEQRQLSYDSDDGEGGQVSLYQVNIEYICCQVNKVAEALPPASSS